MLLEVVSWIGRLDAEDGVIIVGIGCTVGEVLLVVVVSKRVWLDTGACGICGVEGSERIELESFLENTNGAPLFPKGKLLKLMF